MSAFTADLCLSGWPRPGSLQGWPAMRKRSRRARRAACSELLGATPSALSNCSDQLAHDGKVLGGTSGGCACTWDSAESGCAGDTGESGCAAPARWRAGERDRSECASSFPQFTQVCAWPAASEEPSQRSRARPGRRVGCGFRRVVLEQKQEIPQGPPLGRVAPDDRPRRMQRPNVAHDALKTRLHKQGRARWRTPSGRLGSSWGQSGQFARSATNEWLAPRLALGSPLWQCTHPPSSPASGAARSTPRPCWGRNHPGRARSPPPTRTARSRAMDPGVARQADAAGAAVGERRQKPRMRDLSQERVGHLSAWPQGWMRIVAGRA